MSRTLRALSDPLLEGSVNREDHVLCRAAQAAHKAPARPAPARTRAARFAAREVQALRTAQAVTAPTIVVTVPSYLSISTTSQRPQIDYVPNDA
jgi:hypothetical protein